MKIVSDPMILIHKMLTGVASEIEIAEFNKWIELEQNKREYEEIKTVWDQTVETETELLSLREFREEYDRLNAIIREKTKSRESGLLRAITILVLLVVSGGLVLFFFSLPEEEINLSTGQEQRIILPDKTTVVLNEESVFSYKEVGDTRAASLRGEAWIGVTEGKTFVMRCDKINIKVHKAAVFMIAALKDQPLDITVLNGSIEVEDGRKSMALSPGETTSIAPGKEGLTKFHNQDINFNSWYTKKMEFNEELLTNVLKKVEKEYRVKFESSPNLGKCRFTGIFKNASIQDVINTIESGLNIRYVLRENVLCEVSGNRCF